MDAEPILIRVVQLLQRHRLETILIGNAAAALQGAPVTTIDLDFLFRRTPANVRKLKAIATELGAMILRPFDPAGPLLRIARDGDGLQLDFLSEIHGVRSFEELRGRAKTIQVGAVTLLAAPLADIAKSKKAAGRPQEVAVPPQRRSEVLPKRKTTRKECLEALRRSSELLDRDLVRRLAALPPEKRTNFLRKRVGICRSCL